MSTLVTSVTSLLIPQSSSRESRAPSADAEHTEVSIETATSNCNTSAAASDKLTSMGLPPNPVHQSQPQPQTQPQPLPQTHTQQQPQPQQKFLQLPAQQQMAQQLLPAQMAAVAAAGYTNGTAGFSPAYANYTRTLQQHQLQNAFNVAAFQQQQHQLVGMTNPNMAYQAQQNHFAQLQTPSQQQRCAITPTSTTAQSSSLIGSHQASSLGMSSSSASSNSINRSQRCGVCRGCLCKPCGVCTYCQDSPQFGGRGVKKQSCIERRCLRVLENRLQRDAPTFKARMGCNNCDDCRMPDCQICLVCLDRRFFNNRYMSGAICAKKRCNNAVSIELSPQAATLHNNNDLPPSTDRNQAHLKRSYDNSAYEPMSAKRRGMDAHHSGIKGSPKSITPPSSNSSQQGKNVMSPNGLISDISPQRQHLLQQHMLSQQFRNLKGGSVDGSLDAYRSTAANNNSAMNGSEATAPQFGQSGNYYLGSAGYFPNNAALTNGNVLSSFDAASSATAGAAANSVVAYQYQQQQQNLQTQLFCNSYIQQQQKFINYPKYEYYDEQSSYGTVMQNAMLQNAGANPPADPFVPPSYSEMKNAVVLQPL